MKAAVLVAFVLACALASNAGAHDLQNTRATLVLRAPNHLSVTLYLTYSDILYRALSPQRSFGEFVLTYAAMEPGAFIAEAKRAQALLEPQVKIIQGQTRLGLANWHWPDPAEAQARLRQMAMAAIVAPEEHAHEEPVEVTAEVKSNQPIKQVTLDVPAAFGATLVVSYRPSQIWVTPNSTPATIKF